MLDWIHGYQVPPDELHRIFYATRFGRQLNRLGYVRFPHWRVYGDRGLAGEEAVVWLYREQLTVANALEGLAQYLVTYQPDDRHLASVTVAEVFETPYRSPQPLLLGWGAGEWLAVVRVAPYAPRQPHRGGAGLSGHLRPQAWALRCSSRMAAAGYIPADPGLLRANEAAADLAEHVGQ